VNPRQLALVIWMGGALVFVLAKGDLRRSILSVVQTALDPTLLVPAILSVVWNAAVVYGLYRSGLWSPSLWWDTLAFVLVGTTSLVWRMTESKDFSRRFYIRIALPSLGLSVLIGTVASTYTFGLAIELLLVLWLVLLGGMLALARSSERHARLVRPVELLITATGLAMLARAVAGAIVDYTGFLSIQTVRSLVLLFLLTAAYLPYLFLVRVWMTYELAFIPLSLGQSKPLSVRLYARARMLLRFRLNQSRLERFRTSRGNELRGAATRAAVDRVLKGDNTDG
jgi:hypothetical protein